MAIRYALGDLVSGIDRFDGSTVSFDYDTGARLSRVSYPDGDLAIQYLACGRPATASNAVSRIAWHYDGAGRPTNETAVTPISTSSLSQQLDTSGLPTNTHLSVASCALSVERSFDPAARLSTQTDPSGSFAWSYTPWNGLPASVTNAASGVHVAYAWDILDRPTNIVWRKADGDTLRAFNYAYGMAGCITNIDMEGAGMDGRNTFYGYDALDRLIAETVPGRTNAWSYDLAGNRTNALHNGGTTAYHVGHRRPACLHRDGCDLPLQSAGCVTNISVPSVFLRGVSPGTPNTSSHRSRRTASSPSPINMMPSHAASRPPPAAPPPATCTTTTGRC